MSTPTWLLSITGWLPQDSSSRGNDEKSLGKRPQLVFNSTCSNCSDLLSGLASSLRSLSCHRATVTKVKRETYLRTYPTTLVLPDGATVRVRYPLPRQIVKLPVDVTACSKDDLRRIKRMRRPREKMDTREEITSTFDPLKYVKT